MTVTNSVPLFVVESVELQFLGNFVEPPEFACMGGELLVFSELFCGFDIVVDFPNPPPNSLPVLSLCQTETVHTIGETPVTDKPHLKQVLPLMETGKSLHLSRPLIYVIDREADALCYYCRWNIETYFKQMKSAGLEMEHWQQTTGSAIMLRLLAASMALVLIGQLQ
ncbi:MAG: hypothetical protein LBU34_05300 [Planctomycetaceae bacterium]|nr:hypothetical protein [Planctomycetaceae bacterium]